MWGTYNVQFYPRPSSVQKFLQDSFMVQAAHFCTVPKHQLDTLLGKTAKNSRKTCYLVSFGALSLMLRTHVSTRSVWGDRAFSTEKELLAFPGCQLTQIDANSMEEVRNPCKI